MKTRPEPRLATSPSHFSSGSGVGNSTIRGLRLGLTSLFAASLTASAADIFKADNTDSLSAGSSWLGGVAPGGSDVGVWDNTVTGANQSTLGDTSSWGSIRILDPGGTVGIRLSASRTLTLESGGVDASLATQDLNFVIGSSGFLRIGQNNFTPNITVAPGRTVTSGLPLSNQGNTKTFTFDGGGNVVLNASAGGGGAMSFNITGGTNVVFNSATNNWASANTVTSGTLGGNGAMASSVTFNGGMLAPGVGIGSFGTGGTTFNDGSAFGYQVNTSLVEADLLHATNASTELILNGMVTLSLSDFAGANNALALGTKFTLIAYNEAGGWNNGTFDGLADDTTFSAVGNDWLINYDDLMAGSNFVEDTTLADRFVTLTVIPEPSSLLLGGAGLLLAMLRRNRRA